MAAAFDDDAVVDDKNLVRVADGGESVGNGDASGANLGLVQGLLYNLQVNETLKLSVRC